MTGFNIEGRILVVAPHCDDETIGCGGALLHARAAITSLDVAFLTAPTDMRRAEALQVLHRLDATPSWFDASDGFVASQTARCVEYLIGAIQTTKPDIIFAPHAREDHPDHAAAWSIARDAAAKARYWPGDAGAHHCRNLVGYEVWTPTPSPAFVIDISKVFAEKLALLALYPSQLDDFPYAEYVTALNTWRGLSFYKSGQSEAFELHAL